MNPNCSLPVHFWSDAGARVVTRARTGEGGRDRVKGKARGRDRRKGQEQGKEQVGNFCQFRTITC